MKLLSFMDIPKQMSADELITFVSNGFDSAKAGRAAEIYSVITPYFDRGELSPKSHYAYGWIIYYALHQAAHNDIALRKKMLAGYLKLNVQKPHKLHSMILTEAIRLYKDAPDASSIERNRESGTKDPSKYCAFSIMKFCELWNLNNLREGDWRRKEIEGKKLNSTVERLITGYVNEVVDSHQQPSVAFMAVFDKALSQYNDSDTVFSQAASLYEIIGNRHLALEALKNAVLISPVKFFLWSRLADLVDKEKTVRLHIALLHRALVSPGREDFKGKIRISLAEAWISIRAFPQAKFELDKAKQIYLKNGWHLPPRFSNASRQIPADTIAADPDSAYRSVSDLADNFIMSSLPEIPVRKSYHKNGGEITDRYGRRRVQPVAWRVTDEKGIHYWFNPSRHGIDDALPHDTVLHVKVHNDKIVSARLAECMG